MALHPTSVKNSFGSHFILWTMFLPVLALIFVPVALPDQAIAPAEVAMVSGFNIDVDELTLAANARFTSLFIESGLMPRSEEMFGVGKTGWAAFGADWIHGVWLMVYKAVWRLYVLAQIFFLPLLALSIPAIVDGFAVRARKRYRFESSNPIFFYSSMHLVVLMAGVFAFLPLAPITLSANMLFILLFALAAGLWMTASNFQTGK